MTVTQIENVKEPVQIIQGNSTPHKCGHRKVIIGKKAYCCIRFSRMRQMRHNAKNRGLYVPSFSELDIMIDWLDDFRCQSCNTRMRWKPVNGRRGKVITLQHDKDGRLRLLCQACNASEARHKHNADTRNKHAKNGLRHCRLCDTYKPLVDFNRDIQKPLGRYYYCRECDAARRRKAYAGRTQANN